jgi:hypothetical protein
MFLVALFATAAIHSSGPSPAAQFAAVQRAVQFRVLVLPQSVQLVRAEVQREVPFESVRLEYTFEGSLVDVDERVPLPSDTPRVQEDDRTQFFNIDGYPAEYHETGNGYRGFHSLTWFRPDLTVTVSSGDRVSSPVLLDLTLELR